MSPPIIPKQLKLPVDPQGFIVNPQNLEGTLSNLEFGVTQFEQYRLIKTDMGIYLAPNVVIGKGAFGDVEIVQQIKHLNGPQYPDGTFMAMKTFNDTNTYYNVKKSFDLLQIPFNQYSMNFKFMTIRTLAYGDNLRTVLFEDKKGLKKPISLGGQLEIGYALLEEFDNRFETQKLVHCALKPDNIIWDSETKKATIIDEEDVHQANFSTKKSLHIRHSPMYRPPEIAKMPYSPAGDRFSIGVILAEVFVATGINRDRKGHNTEFSQHILTYINSKFPLQGKETLIQEAVKQVTIRLVSEEPLFRPKIGLVKMLFMHLKALNNSLNLPQLSVLEYVQDKYTYFSLYVIVELLNFYKEKTIVPDSVTLELQVQSIIHDALIQKNTDEEIVSEIARHLHQTTSQQQLYPWVEAVTAFLHDKERPLSIKILQPIAKFLKAVNKNPMLYKYKMLNFVSNLRRNGFVTIPLETEISFINYFIANPKNTHYIEKLDELMKGIVLQTTSYEEFGIAHHYLKMRFQMDPYGSASISVFINAYSELIMRKISMQYQALYADLYDSDDSSEDDDSVSHCSFAQKNSTFSMYQSAIAKREKREENITSSMGNKLTF